MAGRPRAEHARTEQIRLRLTPAEKQQLDKARGDQSRSAYLRELLNR